jgi:hypothetical protein
MSVEKKHEEEARRIDVLYKLQVWLLGATALKCPPEKLRHLHLGVVALRNFVKAEGITLGDLRAYDNGSYRNTLGTEDEFYNALPSLRRVRNRLGFECLLE